MGKSKQAWALYMACSHVVDLVASASLPPPVIDPASADSAADEAMDAGSQISVSLDRPLPDISAPNIDGHSSIDLNAWRPLLDAQFTPSTDGIPQTTRYESEEEKEALALDPGNNGDVSVEAVPVALAFLGAVGGVVGIFQFLESWTERFVNMIKKKAHKEPHKGQPPSWGVGIQVGLDTAGLQGSGGNFPQVCLYDAGAKLLGYTDTQIRIQNSKFKHNKGKYGHHRYESPRPEGMPDIQNGGIQSVGVWPLKGHEQETGTQQAPYLLLIKRHYDAICVSSVLVKWPDQSTWVFDGSWGRESNQSWFYSHIFDDKSSALLGECFWLDHRGTLDHHIDREEEYIHKDIDRIGVPGTGVKKINFPSWLWASDVKQEEGIPTGEQLTQGMKDLGVDRGRVAQAVKIFLPAFKANNYKSLQNISTTDIASNPAKLKWFQGDVIPTRFKNNLVLPYLHPNDEWRDPGARIVDSLPYVIDHSEQAPPECLPDFYQDYYSSHIYNPAELGRCWYKGKALHWHQCREKHTRRHSEDSDQPKSIKQHFSRSLVIEKVPRRDGTSAADLCAHEHSMGPSYANHLERQYCRMTDKTLWPFCDQDEGVNMNCFDGDAEVLIEENVPPLKREAHWESIEHWTGNGKYRRNLNGDGALVQLKTQSNEPVGL